MELVETSRWRVDSSDVTSYTYYQVEGSQDTDMMWAAEIQSGMGGDHPYFTYRMPISLLKACLRKQLTSYHRQAMNSPRPIPTVQFGESIMVLCCVRLIDFGKSTLNAEASLEDGKRAIELN